MAALPTTSAPATTGAGLAARRGATGGFRADIQGLRGVAVGLVLLYHAGAPGFSGGFVGVDVFFVISGFLITGLLVKEATATGRVALTGFYARRVRRILPAATAVLLFVTAATVITLPRTRWDDTAAHALGSAAYVVNWLFAADAVDYLEAGAPPSPVQHFWSLAVEEQFYVVWPVLLVGVTALARRRGGRVSQRWIGAGVLAVTIPSLAWSVLHTAGDPAAAYFVTTTRLWELGIGALLAVLVPVLRRLPPPVATGLGWAGLAAVLWAGVAYSTATVFPGSAALLPTLGAAAIIAAGTAEQARRGAGRLLSARPLTWVGDVSYSLYLWHWPLLVLASYRLGDLDVVQSLAVVAIAVVPAYLSFRFVEKPFQHTPLLRRDGRALAAGLALTILSTGAAGTLMVASASASPRQSTADDTVSRGAPVPTVRPTPGDVLDFGPAAVAAAEDNPSVYDDGCHRPQAESDVVWCEYGVPDGATTVALVGDSHAASWVPTLQVLAEEHGWRLRTATKSSCPLADADLTVSEDAAPYRVPGLERGTGRRSRRDGTRPRRHVEPRLHPAARRR